MFELSTAIAASILAGIAYLGLRAVVEVVTIYEYERGLRYREGKFDRLAGPGRYWILRGVSRIERVDLRARAVTVPAQDVLSADGVTLKVTLAARYEVTDPVAAINRSASYQEALYLELQLALRAVIGGLPIDELLAKRPELGRRLHELAAPAAEALGLKLHAAEIKDVMFPGELKKIFTQVVRARQEGMAALEKARGETAALRNLANAAQLVERSPALMQLRLLQTMGQIGGTLVIGVPGGATPLPLAGGARPELGGRAPKGAPGGEGEGEGDA